MWRKGKKIAKYKVEKTPEAVRILRQHVAGIFSHLETLNTRALNIEQRQTDELARRAEWEERVERALWGLRRKADKKSADDGEYERQRNAGKAILP